MIKNDSGQDSANGKGIFSVSATSALSALTILFALFVTGIMLTMAAVAGYDWGGTGVYRPVLVAMTIVICALTHFILAISRSRLAWLFWLGCLVGSVYGEITFFSYANLDAGAVRAQQSTSVIGFEREMDAIRNVLGSITARPVAVVADELARTRGWKKRRALKAEEVEAKRAAALNDRMVFLSAAMTTARITGSNDPVVALLEEVTGCNATSITLVRNLGFSIFLELLGAWLWYRILSCRKDVGNDGRSQATRDPIISLREEIAAGRCKPTVTGIREFLGCGQAKAIELRRKI